MQLLATNSEVLSEFHCISVQHSAFIQTQPRVSWYTVKWMQWFQVTAAQDSRLLINNRLWSHVHYHRTENKGQRPDELLFSPPRELHCGPAPIITTVRPSGIQTFSVSSVWTEDLRLDTGSRMAAEGNTSCGESEELRCEFTPESLTSFLLTEAWFTQVSFFFY